MQTETISNKKNQSLVKRLAVVCSGRHWYFLYLYTRDKEGKFNGYYEMKRNSFRI